MNHADIKTFVNSHTFVKVLAVLGTLIIALFIFEAGVVVGFHKASFASHWQENYAHNFGGPGGFFNTQVPNPHGTAGKIVSLSLPTFVVAGPDENERTVELDDDTIIRDGAATVDSNDLTVGKFVVIIGTPNDNGIVDARLVRIMPAPGTSTTATTSAAK